MENKITEYGVFIIKKNGSIIEVKISKSFDECFETWEELTQRWEEAASETKPFVLRKPICSAFEPGAIEEITLRPKLEQSKSQNNPYHQNMSHTDFAETYAKNMGYSNPSELLDRGFK